MFCIVKGFEALGLGKIVDATGAKWAIEYFDSPGKTGRQVHLVSKSCIIKKTLGANTRIYYHSVVDDRWLVGRVLDDFADEVFVRFSNKTDVRLSHEEVFVRWKRPISDPVIYLANRISETPFYAEARSDFLDSYIAQRGASWGISALLSSVIELEPHQINVIRRVLNDASQRYLLADEVGLGKTVEAGIIIRQAVLDDPTGHRVVVLVPASLVQQWRQELVRRFCLEAFLDDSVVVLPHELSRELEVRLATANLLVIDEAHHLASASDERTKRLYGLVSTVAPKIERLLLLSATPVLRNEGGFLRMLHLLDPVVYSLADESGFLEKIKHRQALAEAVASLDPQNVLQLDWILDDLLAKLPNDARLIELVKALQTQLIALPDETDPQLNDAIRLLRAHLSETYRLHRRILRNRRKQVKFLTPDRSGSTLTIVSIASTRRLESALEAWRINAVACLSENAPSDARRVFARFFLNAVSALIEQPERLIIVCNARIELLKNAGNDANSTFDGEKELLTRMAAMADPQEWRDARLGCLEEHIQTLLSGRSKVVVFCSEKEIADIVFAKLNAIHRATVVRHEISEDEDGDAPWLKFLTDNSSRVIVCDAAAEEGINLQGGGKVVIHFDLPFSANRIEQRMGRVDRYGSGTPVQSVILVDEGAKYQQFWYEALDKGLGVFNRSIASLQYLVDEELQKLENTLFIDGIESLESLITRLSGREGAVAQELKLIDQQEGLDELAPLAEQETGGVDEVDGAWKEIRQSLLYWVVDTLMFSKSALTTQKSQAELDPAFRFQYRKPGDGGHATLIPLSGFLFDFIGVLDFDAPGSNSSQPRSYPYTFHRKAAVNRKVRLLRYGDVFVEAVKSFSDLDDRGRSFAIWRRVFNGFEGEDPSMYFRFDFLIEPRLDVANEVLANSSQNNTDAARAAISRRGDALFPPRVVHVWIDEEGEEPASVFVETYLDPPYAKDGAGDRYIDTNLNPARFDSLMQATPSTFSNWSERCERIRDRARALLVGRQEFSDSKRDAIEKAKREDEVRYAQLAARIQSLNGAEAEAERALQALEVKLHEALYTGIADPSIKVDVVGVIFLSHMAFSSVEDSIEVGV